MKGLRGRISPWFGNSALMGGSVLDNHGPQFVYCTREQKATRVCNVKSSPTMQMQVYE